MFGANPSDRAAIRAALSAPRMSTYLLAAANDELLALRLYGWNARVSSALMLPAHFAEVTTRNAVSEALTGIYGPKWPWNATFTGSLPSPRSSVYNPRRDLERVRARELSTGKVIAELKFAFWDGMFTSRHDERIWVPQITTLFPNANQGAKPLARQIHRDLETIRQLRNRLAHHEPIITRDLSADLAKMLDLIQLRSTATADWVRKLEEVSTELVADPRKSSTMSANNVAV